MTKAGTDSLAKNPNNATTKSNNMAVNNLYSLDSKESVVCLTFSPNRYWLCCSTLKSIKIWDLETKALIEELSIQNFSKKSLKTNGIYCSSMSFNLDGNFLITGYSDGNIKIWSLLN